MKVIYRISDHSNVRPRIPGSTKKRCLLNCWKVFKNAEWMIVADNCQESLELVKSLGVPYEETSLGNAASFIRCLEIGAESDGIVYFVEDDYYHQDGSPTLIQEGLSFSPYVTLFDHPDKYTAMYNYGEFVKVVRTPSRHWRYTISTCLTFASKGETIREDLPCIRPHFQTTVANDHTMFVALNAKGRNLAVTIPGAATHMDLTIFPIASWIEDWTMDALISDIRKDIPVSFDIQEPNKLRLAAILDAQAQKAHE